MSERGYLIARAHNDLQDVEKALYVSAALRNAAGHTREVGRGLKHGFGVAREEGKRARQEAGLATTMRGNIKQGYRVGREGNAGALKRANRTARQVARRRTNQRLSGSAGQSLYDPDAIKLVMARSRLEHPLPRLDFRR